MDDALVARLTEIEQAYQETLSTMADPEVASDQARYTEPGASSNAEGGDMAQIDAPEGLGAAYRVTHQKAECPAFSLSGNAQRPQSQAH